MITVYRYRTMKPKHGQFSFDLHGGSEVIGFTEYWHSEKGWELVVDVCCDTDKPLERRYFIIVTGGDRLDALGEYAAHYHLATHYSKGYTSFLFELTHLSETEREFMRADEKRLRRAKPGLAELGRAQRPRQEPPPPRQEPVSAPPTSVAEPSAALALVSREEGAA